MSRSTPPMQATPDLDAEDYGISEMFGADHSTAPPIPPDNIPKIQSRGFSYDAIPQAMRETARWVLWSFVHPKNPAAKKGKLPLTTKGTNATTTNVITWARFKDANDAYRNGVALNCRSHGDGHLSEYADGIGFVHSDGMVAIDLDNCRKKETGEIEEWAMAIVRHFDSWTEISPSRTGLHIFVNSTLPAGSKTKSATTPNLEVYAGKLGGGRFIAMTGEMLEGASQEIRSIPAEEMAAWHARCMPPEARQHTPKSEPQAARNTSYDDKRLRPWGAKKLKGITSKIEIPINGQKHVQLFTAALEAAGGFPHAYSEQDAFDALWAVVVRWGEAVTDQKQAADIIRDGFRKRTSPKSYPEDRPKFSQADDQSGERTAHATPADEWPEPSETTIPAAVPFPTHLMPDVIRNFIESKVNESGLYGDMIGISVLCALSAAIGKDVVIQYKWTERACLWGALVAPPGFGKSPALDSAFIPLMNIHAERMHAQKEKIRKYKEEMAEYKIDHEVWLAEYKKSKSPGGKPVSKLPPAEPKEPSRAEITVDDVTIEGLIKLMNSEPLRLVMLLDELASLFENFSRYSNGSDRPHYLKIYDSKPITKIRSAAEGGFIQRPYLPICGAIQPNVMRGFFGPKTRDDGLLDRFLFAVPNDKQNHKKGTGVANKKAIEDYGKLVSRLTHTDWLKHADEGLVHYVARMSPDAKEMLEIWEDDNLTKRPNWEKTEAAARGKAPNFILRLSLVFHLAKWRAEDSRLVEPDTVSAAIAFFEDYILPVNRRLKAMLGSTEEDSHATAILAWLRKGARRESIIPSDLTHGKVGGISHHTQASAALKALVDMGWLRVPESKRASASGGAPPKKHAINPKVWG